jgi:NitT/TauT family transport system permease protein
MLAIARVARIRPAPRKVDREVWLLFAGRLLLVAVVALLWQVAPEHLLPSYAVGRPRHVATSLWKLVTSHELFSSTAATGLAVLYANVLGAVIGVLLALVAGTRAGEWVLHPIVTVTYAIPKVALIPVYVIILGIEPSTHVALVVSMVMFTYFFSMRQALAELDADQLLAFRLMGASRLQIARLLVLRSAIPHLIGATRIALPLAFGIEVFAELRVPTASGLGVLLANASNTLDANGAVAVSLVIVLIAYVLDVLIGGRLRRYTESIGMGVR